MDRIEILLKMEVEMPGDPFVPYALAMEYEKKQSDEAGAYYEKLLTDYSDYLPTYQQAGRFYTQKNEIEKAISILKRGIELGVSQKNNHTVSELKTALFDVDDDYDGL